MATAEAVRAYGAQPASTRVWIPLGCVLFIIALAGSAIVVPQLRVLHVLQALVYIAVPILAWRNSAIGLGAGTTIALLWNALQLFVTHNMQRGLVFFWVFLRTGQARQVDTIMVALGSVGHFILIAACLSAFLKQDRSPSRLWKFVGGAAAVLAYFFLIVAIALPRR